MRRPPRPYHPSRPLSELERPRGRCVPEAPGPRIASTARITFAVIWGVVLRFAIIAGLIYLAYRARMVIVTVFASVLLAITLYPVANALSRPHVPGVSRRTRRTVAAVLVFTLLGVALFFSYRLLIHPFLEDAQRMFISLQHQMGSWSALTTSVEEYLNGLPPEFQGTVAELRKALENLRFDAIAARVPAFLSGFLHTGAEWFTVLVELILIPILAFYLIIEGRGLKREYIGLAPVRWRRDTLALMRAATRILRDYTVANLLLCLIAGVAVYIGLSLLDIPYALSLSVVAGVTRFIPVIGPIIGAIPILLFSLAQGVSVAAGVLVFFVLLHLIESKFLLPKLIGDRLHIHGALVLIVLLLGGEFAGIIGMFLAAPVAALVRVILRTYVLRVRRGGPVDAALVRRAAAPPDAPPPTARAATPAGLPTGKRSEYS